MKIREIISFLDTVAPPRLQETYDNAGLLVGNGEWDCTGVLISLDALELVVEEAIEKKCNLIVAHHPVIFAGLKKITGKSYVERTVIKAIKNNIAIYAIHTNLDNVLNGVNGKMADLLGLTNRKPLASKNNLLKKMIVYVPQNQAEAVQKAIFKAGGGNIGNYAECSFSIAGNGTFNAGEGTNPFVGVKGERHTESEIRLEITYLSWLEDGIVKAMLQAHPYEEVAYDIVSLDNSPGTVGSGLLGELSEPVSEMDFLTLLKAVFGLNGLKHTQFTGKKVKKVALCGGAGSFLIKAALASGADAYVTADVKYHEFFDAENGLILADIGHYESEQCSIQLLFDILKQKYPNFAVLKTGINTNPVQYFF